MQIKNKSGRIIVGDTDLAVLLKMFTIGLICSRWVFILHESNFQTNFRIAVFSVEHTAALKMGNFVFTEEASILKVMSILGFGESTSPGQPRGREESRKQFRKQTYFYLQLIISYRTVFSSLNSLGNLQRLASLAPSSL